MSEENLRLWHSVEKTDPAHTKRVQQRGGFTAIDAHYQIWMATNEFGPVGRDWGYTVEHSTLEAGGMVFAFADVRIWYRVGEQDASYGPVRGCKELVSAKGRVDDDAPKKALTDALTKALSHLGFNADVFLGKFDDNKYVADRKREEQQAHVPPELQRVVEDIKKQTSDGLTFETHNLWSSLSKQQKIAVWEWLGEAERHFVRQVAETQENDGE